MKRLVALLGALAVVSMGCGNLFDPAAAVVDGEKITIARLDAEFEEYSRTARYQALVAQPAADEEQIERSYKQNTLTLLIAETVLENEAEERGIEVTPAEVNARVEEAKEELGSEAQLREYLKEEGVSFEDFEFQVRVQLLEEELLAEVTEGVGPSEEEMRAFYEAHLEDFQEVRAQHILVSTDKLALAEDLALRLQRAKPDEADDLFATLAEKHSEDPLTSGDAGDLGWGPPPPEFGDIFADAVSKLEVGEVSEPVRTDLGWHVIRLLGRRLTPFEEVRPAIQQEIGTSAVQEAWEEWLIDAYEEADIKVNEKIGVLNLETQVVSNPTAEDVPGAEAPATATPSLEPNL